MCKSWKYGSVISTELVNVYCWWSGKTVQGFISEVLASKEVRVWLLIFIVLIGWFQGRLLFWYLFGITFFGCGLEERTNSHFSGLYTTLFSVLGRCLSFWHRNGTFSSCLFHHLGVCHRYFIILSFLLFFLNTICGISISELRHFSEKFVHPRLWLFSVFFQLSVDFHLVVLGVFICWQRRVE